MGKVSVTTKTGDNGETTLFGGAKISKSSDRLHAYGDVDELNAVIGLILAEDNLPKKLWAELIRTQRVLFTVGGDLATPLDSQTSFPRLTSAETEELERWIDELEEELPQQTKFILPSGSRVGSLLHLARTVCRRAERWVVELTKSEEINTEVQVYLNRLSDYFFVASREANRQVGAEETEVLW